MAALATFRVRLGVLSPGLGVHFSKISSTASACTEVKGEVGGGGVEDGGSEEGSVNTQLKVEGRQIKRSVCLPTVFIPNELHNAIEVAIAG